MKSSLLLAAFCLALVPFKLPAAITHYVDAGGTNSVPPYTNWVTAATSIQAAIDASTNGDTVLVTNGVYQTGGRIASGVTNVYNPGYIQAISGDEFNRVTLTKPITLQSVNGPAQTVIVGSMNQNQSYLIRCVFLSDGATLDGFTLTNGYNYYPGAGIFCASTNSYVTNCWILGNKSLFNAAYSCGGGACSGTLNNCQLIGNRIGILGGGAFGSILNNCLIAYYFAGGYGGGSGGGACYCVLNSCTVVTNLATAGGGGVESCTLNNCVVYDNIAWFGYNFDSDWPSAFDYCCTTPMPTNGVGNITNDPAFVILTNGDFHLQATSRCINAGNNSSVVGSTDLDGNSRIMGGAVDMGAYEFQAQVAGTFSSWLQQYNLPTDGTADCADSDGTGMVNWQKWIAGLNPTNPASVLVMTSAASTNAASGIKVSWQSVSNRTYYLQRANDLSAQPALSTIQSNIVGQAGTTSYTDLSATNGVSYFYRVGVQ